MWFIFLSFGITFTTVDCLWTLTQHWPPAAMLWAVQKVWWANFLMIYPQFIAGMLVSKLPRFLWSRHFGTKWVHPSKSWAFNAFQAICRWENRPTRYSGDVRQLSDASGCRDFRGLHSPQRKLQTVLWWRKANKCGFQRALSALLKLSSWSKKEGGFFSCTAAAVPLPCTRTAISSTAIQYLQGNPSWCEMMQIVESLWHSL